MAHFRTESQQQSLLHNILGSQYLNPAVTTPTRPVQPVNAHLGGPRLPSASPSSNSSSLSKPKPVIAAGTRHTFSNTIACPTCSSALVGPFWNGRQGHWQIKCSQHSSGRCTWYRTTHYDDSPVVAGPATGPTAITTTTGPRCAATNCVSNYKRPPSLTCSNGMCLQDCATIGLKECVVWNHRKTRAALSKPSDNAPASMPVPSATPILTTSTTAALPITAPRDDGPTFLEVKSHAREYPKAWLAGIATQQAQKAARLQHAALYREGTKEGLTVFVVFWSTTAAKPYLFQRVIHTGHTFSLTEDVELCGIVNHAPTSSIYFWSHGLWMLRKSTDPIPVQAGTWLLFRAMDVEASNTPKLNHFLQLASAQTSTTTLNMPASTGHSNVLCRPQPPLPLPLPIPTPNITIDGSPPRSAIPLASTPLAPAQSGSQEQPVVLSDDDDDDDDETPSAPSPAQLSQLISQSLLNINRAWPDEYTVNEIHHGLTTLRNLPKARQAGTIATKFENVFHRKYDNNRYYKTHNVWKAFMQPLTPPASRNWFLSYLAPGKDTLWPLFLRALDIRRGELQKARMEQTIDLFAPVV